MAVAVSLGALVGVPSASGAGTVTIDAPEGASAGTVRLSGRVGTAGEVTSVVYAVDTTDTTARPEGADCTIDGVDGTNLNGDANAGDVLDCEIAGVVALDRSLAGTTGVQVGLVGFANQAAAADLDPGAGAATFVAPAGALDGDRVHRLSHPLLPALAVHLGAATEKNRKSRLVAIFN